MGMAQQVSKHLKTMYHPKHIFKPVTKSVGAKVLNARSICQPAMRMKVTWSLGGGVTREQTCHGHSDDLHRTCKKLGKCVFISNWGFV